MVFGGAGSPVSPMWNLVVGGLSQGSPEEMVVVVGVSRVSRSASPLGKGGRTPGLGRLPVLYLVIEGHRGCPERIRNRSSWEKTFCFFST